VTTPIFSNPGLWLLKVPDSSYLQTVTFAQLTSGAE